MPGASSYGKIRGRHCGPEVVARNVAGKRLGLLLCPWWLPRQVRLSEPGLTTSPEESPWTRTVYSRLLDSFRGPTCTIVHDEETLFFCVKEVQPVESGDLIAPKRVKNQQRYLDNVGLTPLHVKCRALQRGDNTVTAGR